MQRYKLTIEYDGTGFAGWQRQKNGRTIQQSIEEAITAFTSEEVTLHVSGRTDRGVHALGQVAHVDIKKDITPHTIEHASNYHLKDKSIKILSAEVAEPDFHARFSAKTRHYLYRILERSAPPALDMNRVWHIPHALDHHLMQEAAQHLIGKHDFSTFRAANCQSNSPIKSVTSFDIQRVGQEIHFNVSAPSFLYHQVRNMVGTLVQLGLGKWTIENFVSAFDAKDRTKGGPTAPPQGLYFVKVKY